MTAAVQQQADDTQPGNVVAIRQAEPAGGALELRAGQTDWSPAQRAALVQLGLDEASDADLAVFMHQAQRTKLDPFTRQIYMIGRWDNRARKTKYTIQTGIDGFRVIADRHPMYGGQVGPEWCGDDGVWRDVWLDEKPPRAARVGVIRKDWVQPVYATALFREYAGYDKDGNLTQMWRSKGSLMISKCFSPDTEVLTTAGFMRFDQVDGERIMQVTPDGLQAVHADPFVQRYYGPMVANHGDMLDFTVTPNHDMVTTVGKVEAGAMLATTTTRGPWRIPMVAPGRWEDDPTVTDDDLRLTGYVLADGWHNGYRLFNVSVSRNYKRNALAELTPRSVRVVHSRGTVAHTAAREVRSNFDKELFTFEATRVTRFIDTDKFVNVPALLGLSQRQVRVILDAWQEFDGHTNRKTGVRRIYTSRPDHVAAIELMAVLAGYSISTPTKTESDISAEPGYRLTISEPKPQPVVLPSATRPGVRMEDVNPTGEVWCVTVPSGQIVVRRNGFSMIVGNCAEALALRKAFPHDLSGIYTAEEMTQADQAERHQVVEQQIPAPRVVEAVDWDGEISKAEDKQDRDRLLAILRRAQAEQPGNSGLHTQIIDAGLRVKAALDADAPAADEPIDAELVDDPAPAQPERTAAQLAADLFDNLLLASTPEQVSALLDGPLFKSAARTDVSGLLTQDDRETLDLDGSKITLSQLAGKVLDYTERHQRSPRHPMDV